MTGHDRYADVAKFATERMAAGTSIDNVLGLLRESGFSLPECMGGLVAAGLCSSHGEAKRLLFGSPAWSGVRRLNEEVRDALIREIGEEDRPTR